GFDSLESDRGCWTEDNLLVSLLLRSPSCCCRHPPVRLPCPYRRRTSDRRDKRHNFSIGKHYVQIRWQNGGGGVVYATSRVIQAKSIRRTEVGKRIG
ncbi:hypothetical protein J6590_086896, partial [Homalodisca vitripennis]